jgi:SAM-dependent methyltransferase
MTRDHLWLNIRELPFFRATLRAVESKLVEAVNLPKPTLDLGCGDGHFASVTYARPLEVGLDPEMQSLREAQEREGYLHLLQADGARMPFCDGAFASALSNSVLEHIPPLEEVLADLSRVLRPGAPFVFTVPNPGYRSELSVPRILRKLGLASLGDAYQEWFMDMSRTVNLLTEEEWEERLGSSGFTLEQAIRYFSPAALRLLEWGHYLGAPTLLPRKLLGRWIIAPTRWNLWLTDRIVRKYYVELPSEEGTYTFYLARKE